MAKGRTAYTLVVNAPQEVINNVIQQYLTANQFSYNPEGGMNYYNYNDPLVYGYRGFQYFINGNQVQILVHIGKLNHEQNLEGFAGSMPKKAYAKALQPLFDQLNYLNANPEMAAATTTSGAPMGYDPNTGAPVYSNQAPYGANADVNPFAGQEEKTNGNYGIAGFVIGLIALIIMIAAYFMGYAVAIGWIFIVFTFIFSIKGLKSQQKGLSIAGICLGAIDLVITIINYVIIYANR